MKKNIKNIPKNKLMLFSFYVVIIRVLELLNFAVPIKSILLLRQDFVLSIYFWNHEIIFNSTYIGWFSLIIIFPILNIFRINLSKKNQVRFKRLSKGNRNILGPFIKLHAEMIVIIIMFMMIVAINFKFSVLVFVMALIIINLIRNKNTLQKYQSILSKIYLTSLPGYLYLAVEFSDKATNIYFVILSFLLFRYIMNAYTKILMISFRKNKLYKNDFNFDEKK